MDKKQFIEIITTSFNLLTPQKVSVFLKNDEIVNVRVVSKSFSGMTFSARFKYLNQILKDNQPEAFSKYLYIFEAFTPDEIIKLSIDDSKNIEISEDNFKHSAKPVEI